MLRKEQIRKQVQTDTAAQQRLADICRIYCKVKRRILSKRRYLQQGWDPGWDAGNRPLQGKDADLFPTVAF